MGLTDAINGRRAYFDANILIYLFEEPEAYGGVLRALARSLDQGDFEAVTSELTLAEVLVRPIREAPAYIPIYESFLRSRPHFDVLPITRSVLIEAARLRAATLLKLPDAIHAATAREAGCRIFLTNDIRMRTLPDLDVLLLADYA